MPDCPQPGRCSRPVHPQCLGVPFPTATPAQRTFTVSRAPCARLLCQSVSSPHQSPTLSLPSRPPRAAGRGPLVLQTLLRAAVQQMVLHAFGSRGRPPFLAFEFSARDNITRIHFVHATPLSFLTSPSPISVSPAGVLHRTHPCRVLSRMAVSSLAPSASHFPKSRLFGGKSAGGFPWVRFPAVPLKTGWRLDSRGAGVVAAALSKFSSRRAGAGAGAKNA